ncbi:MAG: hypothetical protein HS132_18665 [Planctomycetia bacterium]|nr:hypothetical protein [Planctomycetia bacterium]
MSKHRYTGHRHVPLSLTTQEIIDTMKKIPYYLFLRKQYTPFVLSCKERHEMK